MRKYRYLLIVILVVLLTTMSCSSDGEEIKRTLDIESELLTLSKEAYSQSVGVTVDKGELFIADWQGEGWGSAEADVESGVVKVIVSENNTPDVREAYIVVSLTNGLRNGIIKVVQSANSLLDVTPDEYFSDFMGGKYDIRVEANVEWHVSDISVDWINVESHIKAGEIIVTVDRNHSYLTRSTTFVISSETSSKEITIYQDAGLRLIHPYIDFNNIDLNKIMAFEKERYSGFIPDPGLMASHRAFTKSLLIPEIRYQTIGANFINIRSVIDKKHFDFIDIPIEKQIYDFLVGDGYEFLYRGSDGTDYYWLDCGEDVKNHCLVSFASTYDNIQYKPAASKPNPPDTPSFDVFPYMPSEITWGATKDDVKSWENANKGSLFEEESNYLVFDVLSDPSYRMRLYSFGATTGLVKAEYLFNELSKIFLIIPQGYMLNIHFAALLASEGFTYLTNQDGYPVYINVAKQIQCQFAVIEINSETPGVKYGYISFVEYTGSRTNNSTFEAPIYKGFQFVDTKSKDLVE